MIQEILHVLAKGTVASEEMEACFRQILKGQASPEEIGAFLGILHARGETEKEILAAVKVMREFEVKVEHSLNDLVDNCGTGGDRANTFMDTYNISTTAALIAAAAGARVAKHGNRSASSGCGSADVLEKLGIKIDIPPEHVVRCIEETNFGFFFAPLYHPAMKAVTEIRRRIKIRTIFNLVGPLLNPAHVKRQLIGISDLRLLRMFGDILKHQGSERIMIVHGQDGSDEISLTGLTHICELQNGKLEEYTLDPQSLALHSCNLLQLRGGSAQENSYVIEGVLKGEVQDPRRDVAVLNAAAVLYVAGTVPDLRAGLHSANEAIDSGKALAVLNKLRALTVFL